MIQSYFGNQKETRKGIFLGSYWAYGLFRFFKSLLGCLSELNPDVLLNNFSKSHPNLTLIAKRFPAA